MKFMTKSGKYYIDFNENKKILRILSSEIATAICIKYLCFITTKENSVVMYCTVMHERISLYCKNESDAFGAYEFIVDCMEEYLREKDK